MSEAQWMESVCKRLRAFLAERGETSIQASCHKRLPYRFEIGSYRGDIPVPSLPTSYQTDLLIFQTHSDGSWTPRVVIEGKLGQVTTHDALTYSAKAATHVQVHPYLRYGILIGALPSVPLRLFRHGTHFDFMVTWKEASPDQKKWDAFGKMMEEEVRASQQLQAFVEAKSVSTKYCVARRALLLST